MRIVNKQPEKTADISAGQGTTLKEFLKLTISAAVLLVGLFVFTGVIVDVVVSRISFETEAKIFHAASFSAPKIETDQDSQAYEKLTRILDRLKSSKNVPPLPYSIVLIQEDMPNAFALPGGTIGVTTGIVSQLNNEIEIAFVIGHELGHFYHRDHLRGMGRALGFGVIMAVLFQDGLGQSSFTDVMNLALIRKYSQDREVLADKYSLELIYQAYGKVDGVDKLFQLLLEKKDLPEWAYMFSTHPSPGKRINNLKKWASSHLSQTAGADI